VKSTSRFRLRNRSRYERRLDSEAPLACAYARAFEAAEVGDRDDLKVFANPDAADDWFKKNDPEGVVFEYEVIE
jgi:hypothetical protein